MKKIIDILNDNPSVSQWKINLHRRESSELFFIKGQLDCARHTDTTNNRVTVYVDKDGFRGDAMFYVYPSTPENELEKLCAEAVKRASLVKNAPYTLPAGEEGSYEIESNFSKYAPLELAGEIASAVSSVEAGDGAVINALEVFVTRHEEEIINSAGIKKRQTRWEAMVEAIPTYNGEKESVELYEQYNFSAFNPEELKAEIAGKLEEVKARFSALAPDKKLDCPVILNKSELSRLFSEMAWDIDYSSVYSQSGIHKKGDAIQPEGSGDRISLSMLGSLEGCVASSRFDIDGVSLGEKEIISGGKVCAYHGSSRFGQYLGEEPSGILPCMKVAPGTLPKEAFTSAPALEIISMSGLQVDFYSDYIGGEVRLAYYFDGAKTLPLTGLSISGKLSEVLAQIRLSSRCSLSGSYYGPEKALIKNMNIF